ncbi:MAG TPA: hypothetical protein VKA79_02055, partial [Aestuariivirgaceae bacterium]|nr:hypothetical protein [Aestuariivirgaceae bacterium]
MPTGRSGQTLPCRQPRVERVGLRRRWLLASTAIGIAGCLVLSLPVSATNECGVISSNQVICTSAGNNYTGGITYNPTDDLTMVVQDGVTITPTSGNEGIDVTFSSSNLFNLDLRLYDSDAATDITTSGFNAEGIFIGRAHDTTLVNQADIASSDDGIEIHAEGAVTINNSGTITSRYSGIYVVGSKSTSISNSGAIETTGAGRGIFVRSPVGDVTVDLSEIGTIDTSGSDGDGIYITKLLSVQTWGDVDISVAGIIATKGYEADGISLHGIDGHAIIMQPGTGFIKTYGD